MSLYLSALLAGCYGRTGLRGNRKVFVASRRQRTPAARSSVTAKAGWKILYVGLDVAGVGPQYYFNLQSKSNDVARDLFVRSFRLDTPAPRMSHVFPTCRIGSCCGHIFDIAGASAGDTRRVEDHLRTILLSQGRSSQHRRDLAQRLPQWKTQQYGP